MKQRIHEYFQQNEARITDELVRLLGEMVREKTVNVVSEKLAEHPYLKIRGEEHRVAAIVGREFDEWGIPYDTYSRQEGRPNLIARIGRDVSGDRLFLAGHMDVVPAGDGWPGDPFEMTVKDGYAYGRGVLDNKGPLVACMLAARVLKEAVGEESLRGQLQIAALADEEATDPDGVDYGIGFLLQEGKVNATMAIIPDIGENMKSIDIAEKGRTVIKITSIGKQAHGSTPERGVNAVFPMARLALELEKLELEHVPHDQLGHPTLNLGEIHGGAAPNIVPGECHISLDIRTVPGMTREGLLAQIDACCERAGGEFKVAVMASTEPHQISPDNAVVRAIQANGREALGFTPEPFGMGGGTYAKGLNLAGVIAVGWGPGDDNAFHVANESVEIRQLVDFSRMLCLVAIDLLG